MERTRQWGRAAGAVGAAGGLLLALAACSSAGSAASADKPTSSTSTSTSTSTSAAAGGDPGATGATSASAPSNTQVAASGASPYLHIARSDLACPDAQAISTATGLSLQLVSDPSKAVFCYYIGTSDTDLNGAKQTVSINPHHQAEVTGESIAKARSEDEANAADFTSAGVKTGLEGATGLQAPAYHLWINGPAQNSCTTVIGDAAQDAFDVQYAQASQSAQDDCTASDAVAAFLVKTY
jgi:hypothetical protein